MWQDLETSKEFFRGNYKRALALALKGKSIPPGVHVGCLIFLGRVPEAEKSFREIHSADTQLAMARFFLGVGYTRQSKYSEARALFARNCACFRHSSDLYAKFFGLQGAAFFRFYCGRYRQAMKHANRAISIASAVSFPYGQLLALDAYANSAVNFGEVKAGRASFRRILQIARQHGGGFAAGARISLTVSEAEHSIDSNKSIQSLQKCRRIHATDTYSHAEVNLELIRQLTLCGQTSEARKLLDETYDFVHRNRNRRQAAKANLRAAYLDFLEGNLYQALHLIRTAELNIHKSVDLLLTEQLKGLEAKILRAQGKIVEAKEVESASALETIRLQSATAQRIRARELGQSSRYRIGEDPLGDLIDRSRDSKDLNVVRDIVKSGFLSLLRESLNIAPGSRLVVSGAISGAIIIVDRGNIRVEMNFSVNSRKLLTELYAGRGTKEALITNVWQYQYHPFRHDKILYTAIKKLRQLMGSDWVYLTEKGYALADGVEVVHMHSDRSEVPGKEMKKNLLIPAMREDLNLRQNEILAALTLGKRRSWSQHDARIHFNVSTMTATRDLSGLHHRGIVRRVGRGRATYYILSKPH